MKHEYEYISFFQKNSFDSKDIIYADFTASGKPFRLIERYIIKNVYPYYANTHSNAYCGRRMSKMIELSKDIIKKSINADNDHAIIFTGNGCSGAINHFIHILNIKDSPKEWCIFVSEAEHNSNLLPWRESGAHIIIIPIDECGLIDTVKLESSLKGPSKYKYKLVSISAGSNITGVIQDVKKIADIAHRYKAKACFDFAATAPYVPIDMRGIDAIFLSVHKFLGGVGCPGLLVFKRELCQNDHPYCPAGGTVRYTSDKYCIVSNNIETRETGGTPNIVGCIKTGLVFQLKNLLQTYIDQKDKFIVERVRARIFHMQGIKVLNSCNSKKQIPIFSFIVKGVHYNLAVSILNDYFNIQSRGGVSCSGVYAKKLLKLNNDDEQKIISSIVTDKGIPKTYGWCRVSFHYTMPVATIDYILDAIEYLGKHAKDIMAKNIYSYDPIKNLWFNKNKNKNKTDDLDDFKLDLLQQ